MHARVRVLCQYQWIVGSQFASVSVARPWVCVDLLLHTVLAFIFYLIFLCRNKADVDDGTTRDSHKYVNKTRRRQGKAHTCFFVEHFMGGPAAFETLLKTYKSSSCHSSNIKTTWNQALLFCGNMPIISLQRAIPYMVQYKRISISRSAAFIKGARHAKCNTVVLAAASSWWCHPSSSQQQWQQIKPCNRCLRLSKPSELATRTDQKHGVTLVGSTVSWDNLIRSWEWRDTPLQTAHIQ